MLCLRTTDGGTEFHVHSETLKGGPEAQGQPRLARLQIACSATPEYTGWLSEPLAGERVCCGRQHLRTCFYMFRVLPHARNPE